jgi:hypothetical protein
MSYYWAGELSMCKKNGPIDKFVKELFSGIEILTSDGIGAPGHANTAVESYPNASYVGALCSRVQRNNLILLPMDDETFERGLFLHMDIPTWETRDPVLFWRGGASGFDTPTLRERVVKHLYGVANTDVKLTHWGGWENGKDIPEHYFGNRCSIAHHFRYKYIPIIDGNCIASNHQWVFGSGAVPLLISHPDNDFWFKRYIQPTVHYVPIAYDLSDLKEKIEWLVSHDEEAKQIATNAMELAKRVFAPQFQREHLFTTRNTATISE